MHHCCTSEGLVVLRDHTNCVCGVAATVYWREQDPWRFGRKLDSEDGGERPRRGLPEGTPKTHLRVGKARGYPDVDTEFRLVPRTHEQAGRVRSMELEIRLASA